MKEILVLFTAPKKEKIFSQLIKAYYGKAYSHVAIEFYQPQLERLLVYHAANGTVHFCNSSVFHDKNVVVNRKKLYISEEDFLKLNRRCVDLSGIEYGYIELFKIAVKELAYLLFKREVNFKNDVGYICSELFADIFSDMLDISWDKPMHLVAPFDIEKKLSEKGYF
jgi:hypothetical protein